MAAAEQETLPATVSVTAASVVAVYAAGEQRLLTSSAALVQAAIANPATATSLRTRLRALAAEVSKGILARVTTMAAQVADMAVRNGNSTAARQIRSLERHHRGFHASPVSTLLPHNVTASAAIAEELGSTLTAAAHRMTRFADDAYRAATIGGALTGINPAYDIIKDVMARAAPAEAQAQAWRELTAKGITGFTDSAGREWNLSTYVEMAVRTATQRAYNASHRERLTQAGIHYFTPSNTGRPCKLCAPWEGKVLADRGEGTVTEPHATGGEPVTFHVAATIAEAMTAGLFHPNCEHTLTAYLPGATVLRTTEWTDQDEERYRNTQRLRALEREVRKHKQVQAAALTDTDRQLAARKVRAAQASIREFVDATGLNRRSRREQLNLGNK
ncbi:phage minor capsid protein [Paenarthrobacter nicotinovorans]|uniref:phage minor capsid protein n=1 Tax=Paenarthrobacter nicotinovorans TaxID=29320 RepID=UPI003826AB82